MYSENYEIAIKYAEKCSNLQKYIDKAYCDDTQFLAITELGLRAVRDGQLGKAKQYLKASISTVSSPVEYILAQDLLDKGDVDDVIQFLNAVEAKIPSQK